MESHVYLRVSYYPADYEQGGLHRKRTMSFDAPEGLDFDKLYAAIEVAVPEIMAEALRQQEFEKYPQECPFCCRPGMNAEPLTDRDRELILTQGRCTGCIGIPDPADEEAASE